MTVEIVESKSVQTKDKLAAMEFLLQLYEDEYSLLVYGPSQFLTREISGSGSMADTLGSFCPIKTNNGEALKDDSNF
jgi:hypothetical protein